MNRISTSFPALPFALAIGLAAAALPQRSAHAEPSSVDAAQARELLREGLHLRDKGDVVGATEKLKAAHALVHTPVTAYELGRTYAAGGKLVEAREAFLSIARIAPVPEETERSKTARSESATLAEELRPRIPSLTVRVTGVPAEAVAVTVDGASVPTEALAAPRFLDPGTHVVSARSTSGGTAETKVDLREGETRDVELKIAFAGGDGSSETAAAPDAGGSSAREARHDAPAGSRSRLLEWSLIGGGVAVGAAGAVLMAVEAGNSSDANSRHDRSAYDAATTGWTIGLVGSIAGAAAVAGGGILWATARPGSSSAGSPHSVWLGVGPQVVRVGGTW
jgi:hypothetical protein